MTAARRLLIGLGTVVMGYAVLGAITDVDVKLFGVLIFLGAVVAGHDGILLPAAIGVGALLGRLPAALRAPVRAAAVISFAVSIVALPLVLGFGRAPDNPSILPLPYGRGLLLTLAVIWVPIVLLVAVRGFRTIRSSRTSRPRRTNRSRDRRR